MQPHIQKSKILEIAQSVETTPAMRDVLGEIREQHHIAQADLIFVLVAGIRPVKDPLFLIQAFSGMYKYFKEFGVTVLCHKSFNVVGRN